MYQTIYIDVDEEITSILDRIKQEQMREIFLVIPKGAMLINSIVNLKLLKKETEKIGKKITVVMPNEKRSKMIVERAGLTVSNYGDNFKQHSNTSRIDNNISPQPVQQAIGNIVEEVHQKFNNLDETTVGSDSFFDVNTAQKNKIIHSNNANSKHNNNQNNKVAKEIIFKENIKKEKTKKLNYFNKQQTKYEMGNTKVKNNSFLNKKITILILSFVILGSGLLWFFVNYPKLAITIYPLNHKISQEIKITVDANKDDGNQDKINLTEQIIPGDYTEINLEKDMTFSATGEKLIDKNGVKAQGKVVIYNYFSQKSQPLVKTTRVLSKKDKKLFRLTKTVSVPGMKDGQPGKIEVVVQADKPGREFNIAKDEFTIEGFKGGEKYNKFKVIADGSMTGGITSTDSKTKKVVSKKDLETARKKVLDSLDKSTLTEIKKRLNDNQEIVESAIEKEIISSKSSHLEGTITNKFSYKIAYRVKFIVFKKDDILKIVKNILNKEDDGNYEVDQDLHISYQRAIIDLDKKKLIIHITVKGKKWFKIKVKEIKKVIKNTDMNIIKNILNKDIGVDTAEIKIDPVWSKKSPGNEKNITIKVINSEYAK